MIRLILLIFAITLDSFIFCLEKGATSKHIPLKNAFLHSLVFASIATIMTIIGYYGGYFVKGLDLIGFHTIIAIIIFLCISISMLFHALRKKKFEERLDESFNLQASVKQAILNGVDTFLLGMGLSVLSYSLTALIPLVFIITFIFVCIAFYVGYHNGAGYQKQIGLFSAFIYFLIALWMLIAFVMFA